MDTVNRGTVYHLPLSLTVAVGINIVLLYFVYQLVTPAHVNEPKLYNLNWVDFIRLKPEDLPKPEPQPLKRPDPFTEQKLAAPKPAKPPPKKLERPSPPVKSPPVHKPATPKQADPLKPSVPRVTVPMLAARPSRTIGDPALEGHKTGPVDAVAAQGVGIDENVTPLYRSAPRYPPRAQRSGIEGVVTVEFTITPEGGVADPVIIKAHPPEIFNGAVLEAITKWRFKPRIVQGKPVARRARQKISFLLNKG